MNPIRPLIGPPPAITHVAPDARESPPPAKLSSERGIPPTASVEKAGNAAKADEGRDKVAKLAGEFEQIFLRKMLEPLQKSTKGAPSPSGGSPGGAGGDVYGSMIVNAMADAVSRAGGLGLAKMVGAAIDPAAKKSVDPLQVPPKSAAVPAEVDRQRDDTRASGLAVERLKMVAPAGK